MKKQLLTNILALLLIAFAVSCVSDDKETTESNKIELPVNRFSISPFKDTTLFGSQGTRIFIESNTFEFEDGTPVADSVEIVVKEFYKRSDIILANLSTQSDDQLLETGGMLNIGATSKGKSIRIKSGKRIVVHYPKPQAYVNSMNLFYADSNATDSSVTNWKVDTVSLVKSTIKVWSWGYYWLDSDDSTELNPKPKNFVDTGYYWNPLEVYVNKYDFSKSSIDEINNYSGSEYVEIEFDITTKGKIKRPVIISPLSKKTKSELLGFINGLPELTPGKNKYGNIVERRAIIGLSRGEIIPLYKSREEYIRSFDKKYATFEKQPIKNVDDAELNYYIFSVGKLGWINCDRFIESTELTDLLVETPVNKDTQIKMVFKDINGVLMATAFKGKSSFSKVPVGKLVTLIGIKKMNGKLETAFQEVTISKQPVAALTFKETTLSQLKEDLEKMN
ncbi:MAG: hypothetical protein K0R51_2546 [Cytophagaceae bacterium]|nr:hypothetical protein [Cytophagaceae bacterium]